MKVAVVTPLMTSGEVGGAEVLYAGLIQGLRESGYTAEQVGVSVDESSFERILDSYQACYDLDLSAYDLVVSTKAPTYMVRHPNHVSYLIHTIRVFYDMFEQEYGQGTVQQRAAREAIQKLDRLGLGSGLLRKRLTIGHTNYRRLMDADPFWKDVSYEVAYPAPILSGFRSPRSSGSYILAPGRLHRWKRVDLVIRAFKELDRDMPLKIAGTGEDEDALRELAAGDPRIEFLGRVSDDELLDLYAGARAVAFVPTAEDYGYITVEAFKTRRPVITCTDSGEPTHLVDDGVSGFIAEPDPESIAARLEYLVDHPGHAVEMGDRGYSRVEHISWDRVVGAIVECGTNGHASHHILGMPVVTGAPHGCYRTAVLDMQPIDPPVGGGRVRLLGLYHALGSDQPTRYIGTYDWRGPGHRNHRLTETLEETDIPLSEDHFAAADELQRQLNGKTVIDVSFPDLAYHTPEFVDGAREVVSESDIVVFSHPWVYPLVEDCLDRRRQLVVYDSHNVESLLRCELMDDEGVGGELVRRVVEIERSLCIAADLILACSHEDRMQFHELYGVPLGKIAVVPNGTFTSRIRPPSSEGRAELKERLGLAGKAVALFMGSTYTPNVEAAAFIQNVLAPAVPEVTFVIGGSVGSALQVEPGAPSNVRITGSIDEEERARYFRAADLAINPMFAGSGTNVKMFDFMAAGLPIVTTPIGARGITRSVGAAFAVVDSAEFPTTIRGLVQSSDAAERMGADGRKLAEEAFSWERISPGLGLLLRRRREKLGQPVPLFSVVVPTYERPEKLWELLECLARQTSGNFEVIVVDQSKEAWEGSTHFPELDLLYIHTDVKGAINARNVGAFYARGDVIAFTDDDCMPLPDWLASAERYFADDGIVGVEGLVVSDKRNDRDFRAVTNEGFEGLGFMTANFFLRREAFAMLEGFDYQFDNPHFREDTDLGWRALELGQIPFAHDVRVYHPPHPRHIERESALERARFFEKDPLLFRKHPERYRQLFLSEAHYINTEGFWENFARGAEKYGVEIDEFFWTYWTGAPGAGAAGADATNAETRGSAGSHSHGDKPRMAA